MKWADFLHADTNLGNLNVNLITLGGYAQKCGRPFRSDGSLKSGASHKWFDESSRLIEWFLHCDSNWVIFGLTTSLL